MAESTPESTDAYGRFLHEIRRVYEEIDDAAAESALSKHVVLSCLAVVLAEEGELPLDAEGTTWRDLAEYHAGVARDMLEATEQTPR